MTYAQMLNGLQHAATKTGKAHVLINLNPFGALYVIRELSIAPLNDKIVAHADANGKITLPGR
jgi:hypothetical protein